MLQGGHLGDFLIIDKLGQGGFGQIFTVRSMKDDNIYAAKVEPAYTKHKTVDFESHVFKALQHSDYFPNFISSGRNAHFSYLVMELLGPNLVSVLKRLEKPKFSLSTGLRVAYHTFKAIEVMHRSSYIHRDIKPANILIRCEPSNCPIAIIDFGLARYFMDRKTNTHLEAREDPGFRGTLIYASIHAHMHMDLSRRDDLISWFYMVTDLLTGNLPWRCLDDKDEILRMKRNTSVSAMLNPLVPEMTEIWQLINKLQYGEKPDYERISDLLHEAISASEINEDDPYDWSEIISENEKKRRKKEEFQQNSKDDSRYNNNNNDHFCCSVM